jgi:hypothetical protein
MVSTTLSGETFYFCTSGCSWLDKLCVNDMLRECSMLVRGECIEDYVESCNWLHHRIFTMNEPCYSTAAKVGDEWANTGGGQTIVQPVLSWTLSKGKEEPPLARLLSWQPAFLTETAVFLCKLNIYFSFRNLYVIFREILLPLSNV